MGICSLCQYTVRKILNWFINWLRNFQWSVVKIYIGTEQGTQNYKMNGWGWKEVSGPILMLKQGHIKQVVQDCVQEAFESLQGSRFHSLCDELVLVLLYSKEMFRDAQREPICAHCLLSWHGAPLKRAWHCSVYTLSSGEIPLLYSRLNNPISLSVCSQVRCSTPFIFLVILYWTLVMSMSLYCLKGCPESPKFQQLLSPWMTFELLQPWEHFQMS